MGGALLIHHDHVHYPRNQTAPSTAFTESFRINTLKELNAAEAGTVWFETTIPL